MNSDDRLRQAFDDLERRAERVDPQFSLQRLPRATERRGWIPALAGAGAVLAVIGVVAVAGLLSGPEPDDALATTVPGVSTVPTNTSEPTTTSDSATTPTTTAFTPTTAYPTHRVVDVADDDVLNVRLEPGASADLVAMLPPTYAGLYAIDNTTVVRGSSEWLHVELLDPARVVVGGERSGQRLTGWVNAAFVEPYDPSLPDVIPCEHEIGPMPATSGTAPDHVYSVRQFGLGGCIRTVVTFGVDFDQERWPIDGISTDMRPAGIPATSRFQVNGTTIIVLDDVPYAWATQSGTFDSSVALIGRWTDGSLAIFVTVPGTTSVRVSDRNQLVIDVTPHDVPSGTAGSGFHLLGAPVVGPGGTVEVWGLARPFEANIGTTILDHTGGPVPDAGPPFVMTTDWTEAWGLFQYRASGLAPGEHLLTLVQEGGEQAIEFAIPFVVPDHSAGDAVTPEDLTVVDALRAFARGVLDADVTFADEVTVSLGVDHAAVSDFSSVSTAWRIDVDEWNGYAGPFDVLGPLRGEVGITTTSVGPRPHCAGPALEIPWSFARQLTIEPAGVTSCLEWYAVSVFLNDAGDIERIMLDLWEP